MSKRYVIEKILQIVITEDDAHPKEALSEELALEIAREIDNYEWQEVDFSVVGVR